MRFSLLLKTLLRTPVKTIVTFLLIAAASFALFSRMTDYAITSRELKQTERHYSGVAALDNGVLDTIHYKNSNMPATVNMKNPFSPAYKFLNDYSSPNPLTYEQIEAFSSLSEFVLEDVRYMTGGIISDYRRLSPRISETHDWGYDYTARFVIEATYSDYNDEYSSYAARPLLKFTDIKYLAGTSEIQDGEDATIITSADYENIYSTDSGAYSVPITFSYDDGESVLSTNSHTSEANSIFLLEGNPYGSEFAKSLNKGDRYIIIGMYMPNTFDEASYESLAEGVRASILDDEDFRKVLSESVGIPDTDELNNFIEELVLLPPEESAERYIEKLGDYSFYNMLQGLRPMRLGDMDTIDYVPSIFILDENYLESEEYARALEIAAITNQDLHTFDIVYTQNMKSIPRFNEGAMVITDGRMIVPEDENSCVVSQYFLDAYDLKLGDTLTIELGDRLFEQNAQMGAITYIPERRWNTVETAELEIVGTYLDIDPDYERNADHFMGYSPNTIFVPLSLLPVTPSADHEIKPGELSLYIENATNIAAFLEKAEPLAEEMGLTLRFSDGGYLKIHEHLSMSAKTSLLMAVMYILGAILALILASELFIGRNKQTYAIMRALGTPRSKAGNALSFLLAVLSVLAVPVGGAAGLVYTAKAVDKEIIANTTLPVGIIILCFVLEFALIAMLTAFSLYKLGKKSPLSLLQGDIIRISDVAKTAELLPAQKPALPINRAVNPASADKNTLPPLSNRQRRYSAFDHVSHYILRHMRRVKVKTAISLLLALTLTGALGVLVITRTLYRDFFRTVDVQGTVTGFDSSSITELSQSELTKELYFYSDYDVSINLSESSNPHIITNDIDRYLKGGYEVEYANGFSDELFLGEDALCVIGSEIASRFELKAGDEITLIPGDLLYALSDLYFGNETYKELMRQTWDMEDAPEDEFEARLEQEVREVIAKESIPYKVAGVISSKSLENSEDSENSENYAISGSVFSPGGESVVKIYSLYNEDFFKVKYSHFILADNEKADELYAYLGELKGENREVTYIIDTTELENIKRVRDLLTLLFPIAVTAAVLIGLTAPALLILQSSKEAAILRVLGTTKKRVRCMLTIEQVALCIIGIILAAGGLLVYNYSLFTQSAETLALCGVLYLLGCVCAGLAASVSVTKRKVLELLQVKE
ncbi:MAG: hypothetical protein FWG70_07310 [Oscillospiraceae bacterium]|nr:hypothetical protein [Oscillospiraceae bacterium]